MPPKKPKLKLFSEDGKVVLITEDNVRITTEAGEPIDLEAIIEKPVPSTPETPSKVETFRTTAQFKDQLLKYNYPPDSPQGDLFDKLDETTRKEIEREIAGGLITREEIVEGIKLTSSENKLVEYIALLLHIKSPQTIDPSKDNYYSGNAGAELVGYGNIKETRAPKLSFSLTDITKLYTGKNNPSGYERKTVNKILEGLEKKKHLCIYNEIYNDLKGRERLRLRFTRWFTLFEIVKGELTYYKEDETTIHTQRQSLVIVLNPIFIRQIESKYIAYPVDIIARLEKAYGSPKIPPAIWKLKDYLSREFSNKRYTPVIGKERLFYLLDEGSMNRKRKGEVNTKYLKGLDVCQKIGLLQDYREYTNKKGEIIVEFTLNKDWLN